MIIAGAAKLLSAAVHAQSGSAQTATGTIYCVAKLELSGDADDGKYWDINGADSWQASPTTWPSATHTQAGVWEYLLPAAATSGKAGGTIAYTFTDNLTEASATTVCGGGEHRINAEDPLATGDIPTAAAIADAVLDEATSGHTTAGTAGKAIADAAANIGTPSILDGGTATVSGMLVKMAGSGFVESTDALHNIGTKVVSGVPASNTATSNVQTTGTLIGGTYASTYLSNGTYYITAPVTPAVGGYGLNVYLGFSIPLGSAVSTVTIRGFFASGAARAVSVWAYNWITTAWEQLSDSTTQMGNASANQSYSYALLTSHLAADGAVQIGFRSTSTTTGDRLNIDQILVTSVAAGLTANQIADAVYDRMRYTVYAGRVTIDTTGSGAAGTDIGVNGVPWYPSDNLADAVAIGTALGTEHYELEPGSALTLDRDMAHKVIDGHMYTLDFGGYDLSGSLIHNCEMITGTASTASTEFVIRQSHLGAVSLPEVDVYECALTNTVTLNEATSYFLERCWAIDIGAGFPVLDYGAALGSSGVVMSHWAGNLTVANLKTGDVLAIDGNGQLTLAASCTGGTVYVAGAIKLVDGSTGVTIHQDSRYEAQQVTGAVWGADVSGYSKGTAGNVVYGLEDVTIASIPIAVWSEAIPGTYTGTEAGAVLNAVPTAVQISDVVWDEVLAEHTTEGSAAEALASIAASVEKKTYVVTGAGDLSVSVGTVTAGSYADTQTYNETYWTVQEVTSAGALVVDATFRVDSAEEVPTSFDFNGRYDGQGTSHHMDVFAYNVHTAAWELVCTEETALANTGDTDVARSWVLSGDHLDSVAREVKVRLQHHPSTDGHASHYLYVDKLQLSTGRSQPIVTPAAVASAVWREVLGNHINVADSAAAELDAVYMQMPIPTAAQVAAKVWDETLAGHTELDSAGLALSSATAAAVADAVWSESLTTYNVAGTAGSLLYTLPGNVWEESALGHNEPGTSGHALLAIPTDVDNAIAVRDELATELAFIDAAISTRATPGDIVSAATVADAVWDEQLSGHVALGSAGAILNDRTVSGVNTATITVVDGAANPIMGVAASLLDGVGATVIMTGTTDSLGQWAFAAPDGSYYIRLFKAGYNFALTETLTILGTTTKTFTGEALDPPVPSDPSYCVIYGYLRDAAGSYLEGTVIEARAEIPAVLGTYQVTDTLVTAEADATGYFELELMRGISVRVTCAAAGIDITADVPEVATQDITTWA